MSREGQKPRIDLLDSPACGWTNAWRISCRMTKGMKLHMATTEKPWDLKKPFRKSVAQTQSAPITTKDTNPRDKAKSRINQGPGSRILRHNSSGTKSCGSGMPPRWNRIVVQTSDRLRMLSFTGRRQCVVKTHRDVSDEQSPSISDLDACPGAVHQIISLTGRQQCEFP